MDWVHEFVPGNTRAACSICGCSRRFPENLTYCVDKLFRCEKCMEITAMERDQQIAAYRSRAEELDTGIGILPGAEVPTSFLADAAEYRNAVLPGWTPSTTFYDDFTIVPGGVGSSWTVVTSGTATVSQPSANVARFDSPTGFVFANNLSMSVPNPTSGRFFCACRAKISIATGTGIAGAGAATSTPSFAAQTGLNSTGATYYSLASTGSTRTDTEWDSSQYVTFRLWWNIGGAAFGSTDDSPFVSRSIPDAARTPYITARNAAARMDVTHYVAYV